MSHARTSAEAARAGELVLDRYRLVRRIGAGGMGVVYLARDERLERDVAVKRIAIALDPEGRGEREALAAARLSHPAIVVLFESGRDDDAVYLVSELVHGHTLAELIRAGALSDRDVVRVGATLCDALEHAHARGVVHRDVKPSNVICPSDGGAAAAKLTDFGIALMVDGDVLTRTGETPGTLAYMAPEQAAGRGATSASDVYSLGVVLYEGLAGVNPIRADSPAATARRVGRPLPPLRRVRRDLPPGLCRAIDLAVLPDPEHRAGLGSLRLALVHAEGRVADDPGPVEAGEGVARTVRMRPVRREGGGRRATGPGGRAAGPEGRAGAADGRAGVPDRRAAVPDARAAGPDRRAAGPDGRAGVPRNRPHSARPWPEDRTAPLRAAAASGPRPSGRRRRRGVDADAGGWDGERPAARRPPARWAARVAAGAGAGGLAAAALAWAGPPAPIGAAAASLSAAAAVVLLPRLGWLATAAALLAWLATTAPGAALVLAVALAPVPLLLPRRGLAWSLPAAAPLLGLAGLAGAWPAIAGQARSLAARAALGALGGLWLVLAEALLSERLLFGQPRDVLALGAWDGSAVDATRDALVPIQAGGTLAIALLWALAAVALPLLVRGRSAALDIVAAAGWAAALAATTGALAEALMVDPPRGLVAGALVAGTVAIAARAVRGRA